jgi:hypothetical protein
MLKRKVLALIAVSAALLLTSATLVAAEELAKRGTYSGVYGWTYSATVHQIEEGHLFIQDIYKGTFFNDAGKGFMHESSIVCPAVTDIVNGKGTARGYSICTDKDGDNIFSVWEGKVVPGKEFKGTFQWIGGTGKYTGIQGNNTFRATMIEGTKEGRGIFNGEWRLP